MDRNHPAELGQLTKPEAYFAKAYPVAPLAERTVATEQFQVPPDALLRLSIGIEEAAWSIDSAPVFFRVIVEDEKGHSQDLFRRILDPARRPEDRRWFESDIDLTDLGGTKVRLHFSTEPAQSGDTRPSLPVWGDPRVLARVARTRRPSVVLVSLDTMRAKSMSTYGYGLETSPNISTFASGGALFANAFTTYANTLPSHMSMLTGLYPATHGVLTVSQTLDEERPTLAEVLRHAGYATAAFTEDALLDSRRGFGRGFSTYYENTGIVAGGGDSEGTFGRALEWAGRNADESFFLFVHTYEVHAPYHPPERYRDFFSDVPVLDPDWGQRAYEHEIRYVDDVLQRFLDGIRRVVPEEDLLLIVTADHGEEFNEHGVVLHYELYEEVMHVPLMMVWPGKIPPGVRIATPVSLVDVVPTILGLLDVPAPGGLDGTSLVPLLSGQQTDLGREAVFGEYPGTPLLRERMFVARGVKDKCFLTVDGSRDYCFDLSRDPNERSPRGTQDTVGFSSVHALGDGYRTRALAAPLPTDRARRRARSAAEPAPEPTPMDGDTADPIQRKLKALGYVQ